MENNDTKDSQEGTALTNNGSTQTPNGNRIEGKIRTIRFIVLSSILYFISDAIGRWFLPAGETDPWVFSVAK